MESLEIDGDPIVSLVPAGADAAAVYAIGGEGLYRSDDGTLTWEEVGPLPPADRVVAAVDDTELLLAGNGAACASGGAGTPVNWSDDGGKTWHPASDKADVWPLAIWGEAQLAVGASCGGLRFSTDGGKTWEPVAVTDPGFDVSSFAVVAGPGERWALLGETSEGGTTRILLLDLSDPANPTADRIFGDLYGVARLAGRGDLFLVGVANGVVVTERGEGTATPRPSRNGLERVTVSVDPLQEVIPKAERDRGITAVAIDPAHPERLYAGTGDGLYESSDKGNSWQQLAGIEGLITDLLPVPRGDRLLVVTDHGVVVMRVS